MKRTLLKNNSVEFRKLNAADWCVLCWHTLQKCASGSFEKAKKNFNF